MDTQEFITEVNVDDRFDSDADARQTTTATLEALSECISGGETRKIAEQLPDELAEHLLAEETEEKEPLEYEAFLSQVSEEAWFDREHAQARIQAVIAALEQTIDEFEYDNMRGQLPDEYGPLFVTEAVGGPSLVEILSAETDLDEATVRPRVRSTLQTLGERLTLGEAEDLAAYLSEEESTWLVAPDSPEAEEFSPAEFVERVADREGIDRKTAREHSKQVADGLESLAGAE